MLSSATNPPSFTEADLEANRCGRVSDNQMLQLKRQERLFTFLIAFVGGSSVIIVLVGIFVGQLVDPMFTAAMIVFAVVEFVALYLLINRFRREFSTDIEQGRVERYEGEVKRLSYRKRRGGLTAVNIGEYQFYVDNVGLRSLSSGSRVRAYVAPVCKMLLSFERLD